MVGTGMIPMGKKRKGPLALQPRARNPRLVMTSNVLFFYIANHFHDLVQ